MKEYHPRAIVDYMVRNNMTRKKLRYPYLKWVKHTVRDIRSNIRKISSCMTSDWMSATYCTELDTESAVARRKRTLTLPGRSSNTVWKNHATQSVP